MPTVQFERTFQAAHRLSGHAGKCSRIHGHNFHLAVEVETDSLGEDGFVIEFERVKELVDRFDHRLILNANDEILMATKITPTFPKDWIVLVPEDPTTEYMAQWFADVISLLVKEPARVEVILRETDSIAAMGKALT